MNGQAPRVRNGDIAMPPLNKIELERARNIAEDKGLKPGRVLGSDGVQFTWGDDSRIKVIDWKEFERELGERGLAIYESAGFMRIMKRDKNGDPVDDGGGQE